MPFINYYFHKGVVLKLSRDDHPGSCTQYPDSLNNTLIFLVHHYPLCYHLFVSAAPATNPQIEVRIFPGYRGKASVRKLRTMAEQALHIGGGRPDASLSLVLADDETVQRLNKDYRGLDETTDVLAFAFHHPGHFEGDSPLSPEHYKGADMPFITPPDEAHEHYLGEVIISFPQGVRQAATNNHEVDREISHLLAHGVLHLLGYDHQNPEEERVMRERETVALAKVGFVTE